MKGSVSMIGWSLLVAVLAVPSFLFYNWWANNKTDEAAVQAPIQSISTATIFAGAQDKTAAPPSGHVQTAAEGPIFQAASVQRSVQPAFRPAVQPIVQPMSAVPVSSAAPAAAAPRAVLRPADAAPQPAAAAQRVDMSTAAAQAVRAAFAPVSTQTASGSYFNPKSDRDPTMTPADYQLRREPEQARREEARLQMLAMRKQLKASSGESRITLQGIVGNSVIINGEMYSVGNTVMGVKILKIGANYLIGEYKGKKFRKILQ